MRTAILGAGGFLGRNLGNFLMAKDHEVTGFVLDPSLEKKAKFECKSVSQLLKNEVVRDSPFDVVINLAARRSTSAQAFTENQVNEFTFEIPKEFVLRTAGPQTLVLNSSTYIQNFKGQKGHTVDTYGAAKEKLSRFLEERSSRLDFKTKDLFFFTLYGNGDRTSHLLPNLLNAAATGKQILLSPGHQLMNLLYIDDAVQNIYSALTLGVKDDYQRSYLWSDEYLSVREIVERIQLVTRRKIDCVWGGRNYVGHEMMDPWDIPMGQLPGFTAPTSLEEGLSRIWKSIQTV
jgi:nucleoside-diphosphate-sugar epimerase